MATSTISHTVTDGSGTAVGAGHLVEALLMPSSAFRSSTSTGIARRVTTTTNGSGAFSLPLEQQANIVSPSGTWWQITIALPDSLGGPQVYAISVGASNANLHASLVTPSSSSGMATYITQASGDERYVRLGSVAPTLGDEVIAGNLVVQGPRPWIDVVAYGADPTGVADSSAALQDAIDAMPPTGGVLVFPPGTYGISSGAALPQLAAATFTKWEFLGYGATINVSGVQTVFGDSVPVDTSEATTRANRAFIFKGFKFVGDATGGQRAIQIMGSLGTVIEDCNFIGMDEGIDLIFCLLHTVRNCVGTNNLTYDFHARSGAGVWDDANEANSGSNVGIYEQCRSYARTGMEAGFYFEGSDGITLREITTEGGNPVYSVKFDGRNATVVKSFTIEGWHSEHDPSGAGLRVISMSGGVATVERMFPQYEHTLIDTTGCGGSQITVVKNHAYPIGQFKGDGTAAWMFLGQGFSDPLASANWVGASVPATASALRQANSTETGSAAGVTLASSYVVLKATNTIRLQSTVDLIDQNIVLGGTTGTKFGTANTQKLAFYGSTPITQPTGVAVTAAGIHAALVSLGLIAV